LILETDCQQVFATLALVSEWVDTGQALRCWHHYDFWLRGTTSTVGLSARIVQPTTGATAVPQSPPQAPNALHDRSTPGNVRQLGSHGRCARRVTSIRRRRRRCGMWAVHARDVRSCTISYDMWPPRYRTLDESAIDIAISCNLYDH